jgi:hypothetical protein
MIFKARIEPPKPATDVTTIRAMEIWIQADGIVDAVNYASNLATNLGFDPKHVTKVIDVTPEEEEVKKDEGKSRTRPHW